MVDLWVIFTFPTFLGECIAIIFVVNFNKML